MCMSGSCSFYEQWSNMVLMTSSQFNVNLPTQFSDTVLYVSSKPFTLCVISALEFPIHSSTSAPLHAL